MRCVICRQADTVPGTTSVTLSRGDATLVVHDVPAQVCPNCGEDYVGANVAAHLDRSAVAFERSGEAHRVRRFEAIA